MVFLKGRLSGILGAAIGLLVAILLLSIGIFKTLFLAFFVLLGYSIGKKLERSGLIKAIYQNMERKGSD